MNQDDKDTLAAGCGGCLGVGLLILIPLLPYLLVCGTIVLVAFLFRGC